MERWETKEMVLCDSDCRDMDYNTCALVENILMIENYSD